MLKVYVLRLTQMLQKDCQKFVCARYPVRSPCFPPCSLAFPLLNFPPWFCRAFRYTQVRLSVRFRMGSRRVPSCVRSLCISSCFPPCVTLMDFGKIPSFVLSVFLRCGFHHAFPRPLHLNSTALPMHSFVRSPQPCIVRIIMRAQWVPSDVFRTFVVGSPMRLLHRAFFCALLRVSPCLPPHASLRFSCSPPYVPRAFAVNFPMRSLVVNLAFP